MTSLADQLLIAGCGAAAGAGVYLLWQAARRSRVSLSGDLDALYAAPAPDPAGSLVDGVAAWVVAVVERAGWQQLLRGEDLVIAGRSVQAHTTARLLHAATGVTLAAAGWALLVLLAPVGVLIAPVAVLFGAVSGVWVADRRIQTLAAARRREAQVAVAAYLDLLRILLAGGLPLLAALRAAADAGSGWTFTQLAQALAWAQERAVYPDEGLRELAGRISGIPEFADLALTITTARRGASPLQALEGKAAFMRGAHSAQARAETAVADAQIELPAAAVAFMFMIFLTYPLMHLITVGTGVLP
jgi:Flp pilus assembly protein TadB